MIAVEKANILLVDDAEANLIALESILAPLDQNLVKAHSGVEALKHLLDRDFAVVLLDVRMPGMNGFETAALIRERPKTAYTPIIFVTAYSPEETGVIQGYTLGAVDFLFKPIIPVVLRSKVAVFVDLYHKTQEIVRQEEQLLQSERREHERQLAIEKHRWEAEVLRKEMEKERRLTQELQESYGRLKELETLRDDLTHMIVHDLRTPLTSIIASMQTLERIGKLDDGQRELVEIATQGGDALLHIINTLIDIAKMEDGSLKLDRENLNAADLIRCAVRHVTPLAREKNLSLTQDADSLDLSVSGDRDLLERTLLNLLGNAVKFTPKGGCVNVTAHPDNRDGGVVFAVSDTGEGIPGDAFDRIFEKFGQVANRIAGRTASSGLGLTFCKMVAEAHGGHVRVESEIGRGSTFYVAIPAHHAAKPGEPPPDSSRVRSAQYAITQQGRRGGVRNRVAELV